MLKLEHTFLNEMVLQFKPLYKRTFSTVALQRIKDPYGPCIKAQVENLTPIRVHRNGPFRRTCKLFSKAKILKYKRTMQHLADTASSGGRLDNRHLIKTRLNLL